MRCGKGVPKISGRLFDFVDAESIDQETFDLSVKNPNGDEEIVHRSPEKIMEEIALLDAESAEVLLKIKGIVNNGLIRKKHTPLL